MVALYLSRQLPQRGFVQHIQFLNAIDSPEPKERKRLSCINQNKSEEKISKSLLRLEMSWTKPRCDETLYGTMGIQSY